MSTKLWGGRFEKDMDKEVLAFSSSLAVDSRLWEADIRGSIAHARMLGKQAIIPASEAELLVRGLEALRSGIRSGLFKWNRNAEDIHSEIERLLGQILGPVAGKLHTARSRNDQVATATRLYLRGQIDALAGELYALQEWLAKTAEAHLHTILPGLTHTQHAQPVSLGHHLLAYFWMFERDVGRLQDCRRRVNVMPLGSAALAGTSFPIDREAVARELGFDAISENSMDAVSDRDFVVEFLSAASLIMTHLSRLCEEIIYWSAPEFAFIELDDSVTTGSSIMPQKKNPDVAELIRGKVGRVNGQLVAMLTTLKALPLSYNRDLQEDKTFLFEGLDTTRASVRLMSLMLESAKFRADRMAQTLAGDFSNATDLADYLVRKGLAFREAHEVVGRIVRLCLEEKIGLEDLSAARLKECHPQIDADAVEVLKHESVMKARKSAGGTGPKAVEAQIEHALAALKRRDFTLV